MTTIRLQPISQQITPQGRGPSPRANIVDVSSGLEAIASGIQKSFDAAERKAQDDDRVQAAKLQNEAAVQFSQWMRESQDSWKRGDKDLPDQFAETFDQWSGAAIGGFKTKEGKQVFAERMNAMRTAMFESSVGWQANTNKNLKLIDLDDSIGNAQKIAAEYPAMAQVLHEQFKEDLNGTAFDAVTTEKLSREMGNRSSLAAEMSLLESAPDSWSADKERWSWNQLTLEQQRALTDRQATMLKQRAQRGRDLFDESVRDHTAMYMEGVTPPRELTKAEFVNKYGEEGEYRFNELQSAKRYGGILSELKNMSPSEMSEVVRAEAPQAGEGFAKASERSRMLAAAASQIIDQRKKDPGLYSMQSPLVEGSRTTEEAAASSIVVQKLWGIQNPKPLPKETASDIVNEISSLNGDEAVRRMAGLKAEYGKAYTPVFSQLAAAGLPASYVAIGAGMQPAPASTLASVANVDMKSLKAQLPAGITPKSVSDELSSQAQSYIQSMAGMSGGEKTIDAMLEASERLAYKYVAGGASAPAAAEKAWRDVIGEKYEYTEYNGQQVRVPATVDAGVVRSGLRAVADRITSKSLLMPRDDLLDFQPEQWAEHVKENGYYVTTENEDGAYLFVDGAVVIDWQGNPFKVLWRDTIDPNAKRLEPFKPDVGTAFAPGGF